VISGALILIEDEFDLNDVQKELVVGITVCGAMISSVVTGPLSDQYGRRPIILISSLIFVAGSILMSVSFSYYMLLGGRFIIGLGVGAASMAMPGLILFYALNII
jgi:SP family myo-inositol transporter-like MFS transporter 13